MLDFLFKKKAHPPIDIFTILGDSNARGGTAIEYPGWPVEYEIVTPKTKILFKDDRTSDASTVRWLDYSTRAYRNRDPGGGKTGPEGSAAKPYACGIDNSFMHYMREKSPNTVGLLKWALGGTTLIGRRGNETSWDRYSKGNMYESFAKNYQKHASRSASKIGFAGQFKGILISLGTNDCHTTVWDRARFHDSVISFVKQLRSLYKSNSLPIFWLQVRRDLADYTNGEYPADTVNQCRETLQHFHIGQKAIPNFHLLDFEPTTKTQDGIHYDAHSVEMMGIEIAKKMLQHP